MTPTQRRAPRHRLETADGVSLWADLRVWAYRGERFMISGRASRTPDGLDLAPILRIGDHDADTLAAVSVSRW